MNNISSLEGISKVKEIKYLGFSITLNKKNLVNSAKTRIKQVLYIMKGRVTSRNQGVKVAIFTAYVRSLIIYHMTSLVATKLMTPEDVLMFETLLKRKLLGISNDIPSLFVEHVTDWWGRDTKQVVKSLADKVLSIIDPNRETAQMSI